MPKIDRLTVTMHPMADYWTGANELHALEVEVKVDGELFTYRHAFNRNDFESVFSYMMKVAERELSDIMRQKGEARDKP